MKWPPAEGGWAEMFVLSPSNVAAMTRTHTVVYTQRTPPSRTWNTHTIFHVQQATIKFDRSTIATPLLLTNDLLIYNVIRNEHKYK